MKTFNLNEQVKKYSNYKILSLIESIELNRGKTFSLPLKLKINRLHDVNKRKSITSSNELEGIKVSKQREADLLVNNLTPETKEEYMIVGYNNALENIYKVYKFQSLDESFILDLHYFLYESFNPEFGGKYKTEQNYIREFDKQGNLLRTVFIPSKPSDVSQLMGNLIYQYNECLKDPECNKLILIFIFILDFLCIHPFFDGNGRVSRLLTTFLLLKNDYNVDKYYSLSYLILQDSERYYKSLEKSSIGWHESINDYEYFLHYMLEILSKGYSKLTYILEINNSKGSSLEKINNFINKSNTFVTKQDIEENFYSLSRTAIEKSLGILVKENKINLVQNGKYAKYYRK